MNLGSFNSANYADVLALVRETTDLSYDPLVSLAQIAARTVRIARLIDDVQSVYRFGLELLDFNDKLASKTLQDQLEVRFGKEVSRSIGYQLTEDFLSERAVIVGFGENARPSGNIRANPVGQLESELARLQRNEASLLGRPSYETTRESVELLRELMISIQQKVQILDRIRHRLQDYLGKVESRVLLNQQADDIFKRYELNVSQHLSTLAPEVLAQLASARKRMAEGDPEARSQALLACRRVLKSVADLVCPAQANPVIGPDGKTRDLTDDKFLNRLWYFLSQHIGKGSLSSVLFSSLSDVGNRLDALNELASKGVHANVTPYETDSCVIQTYIVAGDILSLYAEVNSAAQKPQP